MQNEQEVCKFIANAEDAEDAEPKAVTCIVYFTHVIFNILFDEMLQSTVI